MLKARLWIREHAVAVLLLLVYATLAITSSSKQSSTFDEIVYVSGGYSYWITGDYRIHPENGPLPQRWEALPLLWTDARFPARTGTDWWHSDLWSIGYRFFYGMGNDAVQILALSRGMTVVLGLFLGGLIYAVSRRIHGRVPGYLSLGLFAFCPSMLAHGSLATSDLAVALFFFLAVTCLWNLLAHPSLARAGLTSLAVAALFLTKMSAVILFPVTAILILLRVRDIRKFALPLIFMAALTFVWIWAFYGFRYSVFAEAEPGRDRLYREWNDLLAARGMPFTVVGFLREHKVLPEAHLYGAAIIIGNTQERRAFLNGMHSIVGWPSFFPYAFLVKTPLALLAFIAIAALLARPSWGDLLPYCVLFFVYWIFVLFSRINIGHRYLLPVYPPLFVLAGAAWNWAEHVRIRRAVVIVLAAAFVLETTSVYPHYLAFFNQIAGGPKNGYHHLVDSSLDVGQDLPALKQWLDRNTSGVPVYLSYFGAADPEYYGIRSIRLPGNAEPPPPRKPFPLTEGIYCISATMLQSVYTPAIGPWNRHYEEWYRKVASERKDFLLFNKLRFARLCAFLRSREPDDSAGYSILIYRLSRSDVQLAIEGPPAELLPDVSVRGLPPAR